MKRPVLTFRKLPPGRSVHSPSGCQAEYGPLRPRPVKATAPAKVGPAFCLSLPLPLLSLFLLWVFVSVSITVSLTVSSLSLCSPSLTHSLPCLKPLPSPVDLPLPLFLSDPSPLSESLSEILSLTLSSILSLPIPLSLSLSLLLHSPSLPPPSNPPPKSIPFPYTSYRISAFNLLISQAAAPSPVSFSPISAPAAVHHEGTGETPRNQLQMPADLVQTALQQAERHLIRPACAPIHPDSSDRS
eukprot:2169563-Rhodomonas_salina.5